MLHDELKRLKRYPFHMPGHKRNDKFGITGADIDITEIDGFDNLHNPEGIILDIENRLSKIYGAKKSFLLVNGSTVGMLAAICAVCREGDLILVARNCHKSVYNACLLKKLRVVYIEPEYDCLNGCYTSVMQDTIDKAVKEYPKAKAVVITSPTYEGRISNVTAPVPLIIDAAHGAHLGLGCFPSYPKGSIVVSSLHKTLPALTQTAVVNIYDAHFVSKVKFYLDIMETSSPSYVLMNSVSVCCDIIEHHIEYFTEYYHNLSAFREISLEALRIKYSDDISKIVVSTENTTLSGKELADILREKYSIEPEMASLNYIVLMTSVGDEEEAFELLKNALLEIDELLLQAKAFPIQKPPVPKEICRVSVSGNSEETEIQKAVGKTADEFVYAYPPDIPIIAPGEAITQEAVSYLLSLNESKIKIVSDSALFPNKILTKAE